MGMCDVTLVAYEKIKSASDPESSVLSWSATTSKYNDGYRMWSTNSWILRKHWFEIHLCQTSWARTLSFFNTLIDRILYATLLITNIDGMYNLTAQNFRNRSFDWGAVYLCQRKKRSWINFTSDRGQTAFVDSNKLSS